MPRTGLLRVFVAVLALPSTIGVAVAQAPRLASPPARVSYSATTPQPTPLMPDSTAYGRSYWLEGGALLGGALGVLGAIAGWQLCNDSDTPHGGCTGNAIAGFSFGAVLGFPVGALLGAQFHKHPAAGPPPN